MDEHGFDHAAQAAEPHCGHERAELPRLRSRHRRSNPAADPAGRGAPIPNGWRVYPKLASAGLLWSTAADLARLGITVLDAIRGRPGALLKRATAREMVQPQMGSWGLGFSLGGGAGDSATVGHAGSTAGYVARLPLFPATGQGIAVMTNGESEALIDEIVRAVAREYHWPVPGRPEKTLATVDPAGYAELAGRYRVELNGRNFDFEIGVDGTGSEQHLTITRANGRPSILLPLSPHHFISQDTGNEFTFTRESGVTTQMRIDQQGQRFTARRLP